MRQFLGAALLASFVLVPVAACAAMIDPSLVPDGTYTAKVEKVQDPQHVIVAMENGTETTLIATKQDFSKVKVNDTLKFSMLSGKVAVYVIK